MKDFNRVNLAGRLFSYALEEKEFERDNEVMNAIVGSVTLEVSEDGTCVEVRFFATPKYKSGKVNATYNMLASMMAGNYGAVSDNKGAEDEQAIPVQWLSIDGSVDIDYFAPKDGSAKEIGDLGRSQKIRGQFLNDNKKKIYANTWKTDILVTRIEDIEADDEKQTPHRVRVHGYLPNGFSEKFSEAIYEARDEKPINYLIGLVDTITPQNPLFTTIKGEFRKVVSTRIQEGAFGENETISYENTYWILTWMPLQNYIFGEDITQEQFDAFKAKMNEYKQKKLDDFLSDGDEKINF